MDRAHTAYPQRVPSRVLILTNQLHTGGAEIYVITVSRWLVEHGAEVAVAATPGELVDSLHNDVQYHPIGLRDLRLGIPAAALQVRALIKRFKPDVILANSMVTAWVARLANPSFRVPVAVVAHGWPVDRYKLVARPLAIADRVVPVSHDVARRLQHAGLNARKCHVVQNGIDLGPFGPRTPEQLAKAREIFGAGPDDLIVTNIGRYTEQKAQHHILEVARRLAPTHPHLKFGIIGWGELESDLRRQIAQHRLEDTVKLLIRRTDVPDLLMASDLYLSTSLWEGMPLSMIEAMAASLPIITTNVEGMSALVSSANGLLCPVDDVEALTEATRRLADDEVMRLQRGSMSRSRAETKFSKQVMCSKLVELLNSLAD